MAHALAPLTRLRRLKVHLDLVGPDPDSLREAAPVLAHALSPSLRLMKICGHKAAWYVWDVNEGCAREWEYY